MSNDHIKSEISSYLAGGLPEARNRQIDAHLAECEKCRQAVSKVRGKQARSKREALKKASPDPLPNLFLARQGKNAGVDRPPSKAPWVLFVGLLLAGVVYAFLRHSSTVPPQDIAPDTSVPAAVEVSSAPAASPVQVAAPPVTAMPPVPAKPPPETAPIVVKQEWKGAESGIKDSRVVVIRNDNAWDGLWTEMQGTGAPPLADFSHEVIAGVFAGPRAAGSMIVLGRIVETDQEVIVPYRISSPEITVSTTTLAADVLSHPYLLSLLPRTDKKIRMTRREVAP